MQKMKIKHYLFLVIAGLIVANSGCKKSTDVDAVNPYYNSVSTPSSELSGEFLIDWWKQLFSFVQSERIGPPDASRMFAYISTAIYEAQLPGNPDYLTLAGQLNGLKELPRPDKDEVYDWTAVTNEAIYYVQDEMLARFLPAGVSSINDLHSKQIEECSKVSPPDVIERSLKYGHELADAIIAWSETDNYEQTRYMQYKSPSREGHSDYWEPTDFNGVAAEPFWGTVRPFAIKEAKQCDSNMKFAWSMDSSANMYKEVLQVYTVDKNLTEDQRITAQFWSDDQGESSGPPGHWLTIVGNFVSTENMSLSQAAEIYALTSISMADACVAVWFTKFRVNLVRPKTMINEYFEKGWEPYVETPSFPGYTSGHSGFSGAAATVLTSLIGDNKSFIDSSHMDVGLLPRTMKSFNEAAEEAAFSRMYGGIHYTCEILDGLEQGKCAANEILNNVIINAKRQDVTGKKKDTEMSKSEDEESAM